MATNNICDTKLIDAPGSLISCNKVFLFKRDYLRDRHAYTTVILPQNLEEEFIKLSEFTDSYYILYKDVGSNIFEYDFVEAQNILPDGFDIAIFVDTRNKPIAITTFYTTQGKLMNLKLNVEAVSFTNKIGSLEVANNLVEVANIKNISNTSLLGTFIEKEGVSIKNNLSYSTDAASILEGAVVRCGKNIIYGQKRYNTKLNTITLTSDLDLMNRYNNKCFGYYRGVLSVYSWNEYNYYEISSLVARNSFDNNIIYSKTDNYAEENHIDEKYEILYGAGKYFVCKDKISGKEYLFDITKHEFFTPDQLGNEFYINPLDIQGEIIKVPKTANYETFIKFVPDIAGTFINLKEEITGSSKSLELVRRIGNWFIFKSNHKGNILYLLSGISSGLYLTEEEYNNSMIVNDTTVIIDYDEYYRLYNSKLQIMKTESYLKIVSDSDAAIDYPKAYKNCQLMDTFFNYFRINRYPTNMTGLPKFIGACGGFIFYEEQDDIINYL